MILFPATRPLPHHILAIIIGGGCRHLALRVTRSDLRYGRVEIVGRLLHLCLIHLTALLLRLLHVLSALLRFVLLAVLQSIILSFHRLRCASSLLLLTRKLRRFCKRGGGGSASRGQAPCCQAKASQCHHFGRGIALIHNTRPWLRSLRCLGQHEVPHHSCESLHLRLEAFHLLCHAENRCAGFSGEDRRWPRGRPGSQPGPRGGALPHPPGPLCPPPAALTGQLLRLAVRPNNHAAFGQKSITQRRRRLLDSWPCGSCGVQGRRRVGRHPQAVKPAASG
mmetsp:Transcript_92358/g.197906  ORF Transcript_92358/g.197906 Transcript_92358/m.197906 type:complete len:280 (+) Transcript_92358:454-1293(+)